MYIYIVQPGDTLYTIANAHGVSPERLALENDIQYSSNLVPGEALVIIQPSRTYIVQEGDTLESIALSQQIDIMELLRNNPSISDRGLYMDEELVISYAETKTAAIEVNGFTYPFVDRNILKKTLPYLTYLTIYSYQFTRDGNLIETDDMEIIRIARSYGVAPIMYITTVKDENNIDTEIAHILVSDTELQNKFIENIIVTLQTKGYYGINMDTPYIQPLDRELYVTFIETLTRRLNNEGFFVTVTVAPSLFEAATGITYTGVDFVGLSQAANTILYQLTYEWKYPYYLPISILPFDAVLHTLSETVAQFSPSSCILGITNIGFVWEFPYFSAITEANFINYHSAIELAYDTNSVIELNAPSRSAYFHYIENAKEYMAWFKDSRAIYSLIAYSQELGMRGISIWNIMSFITNIWLLIHVQFEIKKVL
ncbi:LysM peptidoglycan-binding domain-containing protein [Anaerocolumna sp.]|uniref:LysM peptidoglycan-binding domain-containing protein n=1 Tax=Anaerocolumna sp. TaxID=2041569 RepID=UPI0028AFFBB5|nr:LysM peptidoglycan-binding domain-containing protein [Anaerocolumna sp.]